MKKIVLFDVDNVLINGQTQKLLLQFLFKKRKIGLLFFLKVSLWFLFYKIGFLKDTVKIRKYAYSTMFDWDEAGTKMLFKEFFEREIKSRVFSQSVDIIKKYVAQGYEVILTSASISEIVDELKEYLSLKFAISARLEIVNGKYTGKIVGEVPYGENKVKEVKKLLDNNSFTLEGSYAYADHFSDLPLLEKVENPIVVNPDRKLRKIAAIRNWSMLQV